MSRKITVATNLGRPKPKRAEPAESVPRVARLLALAHHWRGLIRDGTVRDRAELARLVGVSRARVSQVMRLLDLAPEIQEAVLDGEIDGAGAELMLRDAALAPCWHDQQRVLDADGHTHLVDAPKPQTSGATHPLISMGSIEPSLHCASSSGNQPL